MRAGSFEGDVLFAPANTEISVISESELQLYRAGLKFFISSLLVKL